MHLFAFEKITMKLKEKKKAEKKFLDILLGHPIPTETEFCNSVIGFQYRFRNSELVNSVIFWALKLTTFGQKLGDFNIFQKYTFSKLIPFQNSIAKRFKFGFEMKKNGIMTFHKFMLFMNFVKIWQFLLLLAQILNSVINSVIGNEFRF